MMFNQDTTEVLRDIEASLIPSGTKVTLKKGTLVAVTQSLGTSYTVNVNGNLVRIPGSDGDAIGLIILEEPDVNEMTGSTEDKVWEILKSCFDPEIPVNIVDLGLVYGCVVSEEIPYEINIVITMTLTAPGCGMGPVLIADIEAKIYKIKNVTNVTVNLVFDPPWDRSKMSEVAKLQLGML
jgi:probable FeS assembly SUF system protein SufT